MNTNLALLAKIAMFWRPKAACKIAYELLSGMGVRPTDATEDERYQLFSEYVRRKYSMRGSDTKVAYAFLKSKFTPSQLKKALGK